MRSLWIVMSDWRVVFGYNEKIVKLLESFIRLRDLYDIPSMDGVKRLRALFNSKEEYEEAVLR